MLFDILLVLGGLIALVIGGDVIIRGAVGLAGRWGMSRAMIGATIVGFGTSLPEFVATFSAGAKDADGIAFGNVIGSDIVNILLILGVSALIFPMALPKSGRLRDLTFVMLASLGCALAIWLGGIPTWMAGGFLALFVIYMIVLFKTDSGAAEDDLPPQIKSQAVAAIAVIVGMFLLVGGAEGLIRGASAIAGALGVPEAIIGITIVGVGTSAPELFASIMASIRRENAIAFGNVIGSNIFNVFAILGLTGLIFPLQLSGFSWGDGAVLIVATIAMFYFGMTGNVLKRWEGAVLVAGYLAYLAWLIMRLGGA